MYGVALFFILRRYYANGNSGLPSPTVLAAPTYLYGIAALTTDFAGGFPVLIAAGMTMALIWQTETKKTSPGMPAGSSPPLKTGTSPTVSTLTGTPGTAGSYGPPAPTPGKVPVGITAPPYMAP